MKAYVLIRQQIINTRATHATEIFACMVLGIMVLIYLHAYYRLMTFWIKRTRKERSRIYCITVDILRYVQSKDAVLISKGFNLDYF